MWPRVRDRLVLWLPLVASAAVGKYPKRMKGCNIFSVKYFVLCIKIKIKINVAVGIDVDTKHIDAHN